MGCYLPPDVTSNIYEVVRAINQQPHEEDLLVAGDFNTYLALTEGHAWYEEIAEALATAGLEDISTHFLPPCKPWLRYGRAWIME